MTPSVAALLTFVCLMLTLLAIDGSDPPDRPGRWWA